mmetsp:Transcript_49670/g.142930  ORF Transcript_49670/g.142930 Transcript_49670/m.142930 type:complete len:214 (+) Transcript_49670:183-824(+)
MWGAHGETKSSTNDTQVEDQECPQRAMKALKGETQRHQQQGVGANMKSIAMRELVCDQTPHLAPVVIAIGVQAHVRHPWPYVVQPRRIFPHIPAHLVGEVAPQADRYQQPNSAEDWIVLPLKLLGAHLGRPRTHEIVQADFAVIVHIEVGMHDRATLRGRVRVLVHIEVGMHDRATLRGRVRVLVPRSLPTIVVFVQFGRLHVVHNNFDVVVV